jgi:hypothetical protein
MRPALPSAALVALIVVTCASAMPLAQSNDENRLKAAIVAKIPQFVEWPASALSAQSTHDICVMGPDAVASDLRDLVGDESLGGRRFAVRLLTGESNLDGCLVLYVTAVPAARHSQILQRASSRPILTIGDAGRFLDDGGIVQLKRLQDHVRFDINATAAERSGLRISSQLLQLADNVRGGVR